MRDIGKNIRDLRLKKNMTQDELAEKLFVTRQTVSNYETGRTRPDVDMVVRIAEILGTDANTVLYGIPAASEKTWEIRKFTISLTTLAIALPLYYRIGDWVQILKRTTYIVWPVFLLSIFLSPAVYLLIGWTLMQALGAFTKLAPISNRASLWVRISILIVGIFYLCVMVPYCAMFWTEFRLPIIWQKVVIFIMGALPGQWSILSHRTVSFLFGLLLWLFRIPKTQKETA